MSGLAGIVYSMRFASARPDGATGLELGDGIAGNDSCQLRVTEITDRLISRRDEQLGADMRTVDDRGQGDRSFGLDPLA